MQTEMQRLLKNPCAPDVNIVQEEIQTIYLEEVHASAVAEEKW